MKTTISSSALLSLLLTACSSTGTTQQAADKPTSGDGSQRIFDLLDCKVDIRPHAPMKKEGFTIQYDWPNRAKKDVLKLWITPVEQASEVGVYTTDDKLISKIPVNTEVPLVLTWNLNAHSVEIAGQNKQTAYLYGQRIEDGPIHSPAFSQQQKDEMIRVRCFNEGLSTTLVVK